MRVAPRLLMTTAGAAAALLMAPTAAVAAQKAEAPAQPKRDLSKDFIAAISPYSKALEAKDYASATAAIEAARAKADNPDERYTVDRIAFDIANAQNDNAARMKAISGALASGAAPANEQVAFNGALATQAFNDNNDAEAIRYATAAKAAGSTDPNMDLVIAQSYGRQKDYPKAIAAWNNLIAREKAAGKTPQEDYYKRVAQYAYQTGDSALLNRSLQDWLVAYPTQKNWRDTLTTSMVQGKYAEPVQLDFFRLMRASDALTTADDWRGYAELASYYNLNGEVIAAVDAGSASGLLDRSSTQEIYTRSKAKSAEDRSSLVNEANTAAAKTTAKPVAAAADALVGYGDYAKAIDLYKIALTKPGVDANEVRLRMGIAQTLAGSYADAITSFGSVEGERQVLATYWTLWVNSRMGA